ncbi:hypothetical protein F4859DRAFT_222762 [Xylaria cf. heliscus]|nr:hypothetical protein F4859DRAFT_222762 [Xylaria cf. heliscus]
MLNITTMKFNISQLNPLRHFQYQPVGTVSGDEHEDDDSPRSSSTTPTLTEVPLHEKTVAVINRRSRRLHGTQILFVVSSICLLLSISFYTMQRRGRVTDDRCMHLMSAPSPAFESVRYEWTTFNDVFQPDEYSGYPSKSSEAAWAKLWDFGAFSVPVRHLAGLNKSSETADFRFLDEDNVAGLLEGAHQIHCLNLVRQFIYRDYWDYSQLPSFQGGNKTRRAHVDHCIETLRMVLTCNTDIMPYTLQTSSISGNVIGRSYPRKCRVYSDIVTWVNSNSVVDKIA